jgi:hypothetical protein
MKKLNGLKNSISSFENNKLENLNKINAGLASTEATIQSETQTTCCGGYGPDTPDKITKHDSGRTSTLIVG